MNCLILQNGWKNDLNKADNGAFFADNLRKIDMVLAFEDSDSEDSEDLEDILSRQSSATFSRRSSTSENSENKRKIARKVFEKNLVLAGLELEHAHKAVKLRKTSILTCVLM